jgi:hypothetical protein
MDVKNGRAAFGAPDRFTSINHTVGVNYNVHTL